MPICLIVGRRAGQGESATTYRFRFDREEVLVGRSSSVDVRLPDPAVSLVHASLRLRDGCLLLSDLGSTNGTFLQHERVAAETWVPVDSGARIKIGPFELRVATPEEAAAETQPRDTASYARRMVVDLIEAMAGGEAAWPYLEILSGPRRGTRHTLASDASAYIGRGEDCQLSLPDPDASRCHVRVDLDDNAASAGDLDSKNGLWVNERRVATARLQHADRLRIGATVVGYFDPAESALSKLAVGGDQSEEDGDLLVAIGAGAGANASTDDGRSGSAVQISARTACSGELSTDRSGEHLSPASAFEVGHPESVVARPQLQNAGDAEQHRRGGIRDDVLVILGAVLLVACAVGLILYLLL